MKAGAGNLAGAEAQWYAEYRFRKLIPLTHEQYLDEPGDSIQWMVRIDDLVRRIEADENKKANG